jgi:O-antigen/teichoic acid export membrane protein
VLRRADGVVARLPLPEGTLPVGFGVLIAGICTFAFFRVGTFALGEDGFKPVSSLWFATFALAPGFFLPLEQELGRALSARRAVGEGGRPVVRRVALLGAALATLVALTIAAFGPLLRREYFDGSWVMVIALIVAIAAYAPAHISRGTCSGSGRFNAYAVVLGGEGVMRIVFCLALAVVGVKAVGAYGFAVALAPLVGVIYVLRRGQLRTDPGPEADWAEVTPNLGWLLVGSVMAACLVNAGPITANLLADSADSALVTRFGYGVIVARVPLFLFQAVQAALLPRLSRLATTGEMTEFRRGFGRLMAVVLAVGVIGTMAAYTLGPFVINKLYDAPLTRRTLTMLALGSVCFMVALAAAQAVIALHGHALVALGWTMGMVVFVGVTAALGGEVFRRVEIALLAGSAASMVTFLLALRSRLRSGATVDQASLMDAVTDWPIEA